MSRCLPKRLPHASCGKIRLTSLWYARWHCRASAMICAVRFVSIPILPATRPMAFRHSLIQRLARPHLSVVKKIIVTPFAAAFLTWSEYAIVSFATSTRQIPCLPNDPFRVECKLPANRRRRVRTGCRHDPRLRP
jgi:hypothetical protein